jgi:heptosyltransferase II
VTGVARPSSVRSAGLVGTATGRSALVDRLLLPALRVLARVRRRQPVVTPARILVLQLQQVGDSVIFTPALGAIHRRFPDAILDVLANPVSCQLYEKFPYVRKVWVDPGAVSGSGRVLPPVALLRRLRAERYDLTIACVAQHSLKYGLVSWLTGAPARFGFDVEGRGVFYTHALECPADLSYLLCNLQLARALGADVDDAREELHFDAADASHADRLLKEAGVNPSHPLVIVHPASNWQSKTWFEDRWAALADALASEGAQIVFVGTAKESAYVESVRAVMRAPSASLAGRTSLTQLTALLDRCHLFVGTDSGPRHLAGALGRPQVTVMSSQDYAHRWTLARPNEVVLRTDPECSPCLQSQCGHRRCMQLIETFQAVEASRELLRRPAGAPRQAVIAEVFDSG